MLFTLYSVRGILCLMSIKKVERNIKIDGSIKHCVLISWWDTYVVIYVIYSIFYWNQIKANLVQPYLLKEEQPLSLIEFLRAILI